MTFLFMKVNTESILLMVIQLEGKEGGHRTLAAQFYTLSSRIGDSQKADLKKKKNQKTHRKTKLGRLEIHINSREGVKGQMLKGLLPWHFSHNASTKAELCDHLYGSLCRPLMLILPQCNCRSFPPPKCLFPQTQNDLRKRLLIFRIHRSWCRIILGTISKIPKINSFISLQSFYFSRI